MVVAAQDRGYGGIQWSAALRAGLIAGTLYIGVEMFFTPVFLGESGLVPLQRIAAIVLGARALAPPENATVETFLTGIGVHLVLSLLFTSLIAAVVHRSGPTAGVMVGAMAGLVLYTVNYYAFAAVFPWFVSARTWVTVFAHLLFGFVGAWVYKTVQTRTNPLSAFH